jgi:PII-like signaling protein
MHVSEESVLLRVFIGESDRVHGQPLYERIVMRARELDLAGATVTRGIMGFGADSRMHSAKLLALSGDLPVVVEIVDAESKVEQLLPFLDDEIQEVLVTLEPVRVIKYRHSGSKHA